MNSMNGSKRTKVFQQAQGQNRLLHPGLENASLHSYILGQRAVGEGRGSRTVWERREGKCYVLE